MREQRMTGWAGAPNLATRETRPRLRSLPHTRWEVEQGVAAPDGTGESSGMKLRVAMGKVGGGVRRSSHLP